jgi:hypothetical protein
MILVLVRTPLTFLVSSFCIDAVLSRLASAKEIGPGKLLENNHD